MMGHWTSQKVLVAGGTGLIGTPLTRRLMNLGATVWVASLDARPQFISEDKFFRVDLRNYQDCLDVTRKMDYVFNLLCVKGSPQMVKERPATFYDTLTTLNSNLARAALKNHVDGFLYTSSVGVYAPSEIMREDDVWQTQPSQNDWFAGHAKRGGELQIEAYRIEHHWTNTAIVRPSNVYGPYDNFDPDSALFVASKIRQFAEKENPIVVWGDGSQIRDFIHSEDAARGMILAAEKSAGPLNLCSGKQTTIKEVVEILAKNSGYEPEIIFDDTKPAGDAKRLLDVSRLNALGFNPQITLEEGLLETLDWYKTEHGSSPKRYNIFKSNKP